MMNFIFSFAADLFDDIFNNSMFAILPLTFLLIVGVTLLGMLKDAA